MVLSLSVYPVLPDKVSIRRRPFIDFIFSVREFIRDDGFAIFIEFKGIVGALGVDGLLRLEESDSRYPWRQYRPVQRLFSFSFIGQIRFLYTG